MKPLTPDIRAQLEVNHRPHDNAMAHGRRGPNPVPVLRRFNPVGHRTWLATEFDPKGVLFGIADLGFGYPELGSFSLCEMDGS